MAGTAAGSAGVSVPATAVDPCVVAPINAAPGDLPGTGTAYCISCSKPRISSTIAVDRVWDASVSADTESSFACHHASRRRALRRCVGRSQQRRHWRLGLHRCGRALALLLLPVSARALVRARLTAGRSGTNSKHPEAAGRAKCATVRGHSSCTKRKSRRAANSAASSGLQGRADEWVPPRGSDMPTLSLKVVFLGSCAWRVHALGSCAMLVYPSQNCAQKASRSRTTHTADSMYPRPTAGPC